MTAPDERVPSTTAWAIAVAAAVGTLGIAVSYPTVVAGAVLGVVAVAVARGFDGTYRRVTVASALLPALALGLIAALGGANDPITPVLTFTLAIAGLAVGLVVAGGPTETAIERTGSAALGAGVAAGGASILALVVSTSGGPGSALAAVLWLTGDGVSGLLYWLILVGVAVVIGVFAVPPAAFATPATRVAYGERRTALAWWVGAATALAVGLLVAASVLAWLFVPLGPVLDAIANSPSVRALVASAAAIGLATAAVGAVVRGAWSGTNDRENVAVPIVIGGILGAIVPLPIAVVAVGGQYELVAGLFAASALVLGAAYAAARVVLRTGTEGNLPAATSAVAAALVASGFVAAGRVDPAPALETVRAALVPLVAIAAGLFAYDLGRYGRTLGREIGRDGTSRRPQLIRIGWGGGVAAIGVPVAAIGAFGATAFALTLSVPATAGALGGLAAFVAAGWLLFR